MSKNVTYFLLPVKSALKPLVNLKLTLLLFLLSIISNLVNAQIKGCTGVLGSPLVNIDFGTGTVNESANPAIMTTTYNPANWGTVSDGGYTISSNPVQNFGWHAGEDHTAGDVNGRMLIVNADVAPGIFAKIAVNGLCPKTNFEFSAWITHLSMKSWCDGDSLTPNGEGPFKPVNVKFIIEDKLGNVIKEGSTGDIQVNRDNVLIWRPFALSFNTGTNTDVVLKLQNNGKGGCGNDLAIDDISFAPCGPVLKITPENACSNEPVTIKVTGAETQYTNPAYLWQKKVNGVWVDVGSPTTNPEIITTIENLGKDSLVVDFRIFVAADLTSISNDRCRISQVFHFIIYPAPVSSFTYEVPYCVNGIVKFKATATNAKSYDWTFEQGNPDKSSIANPTVTWTKPGPYKVTLSIKDANGCSSGKNAQTSTININDKPKLDLSSSNNFLFCINGKVKLIATKDKYKYEWFKNGSKIPGADSSIYEASQTGTYQVKVTDVNGCTRDTSVTVRAADAIQLTQSTINNVTCKSFKDGKAWVKITFNNANVDTSNYNFQWSPNVSNYNKAINLWPNKYKVYAVDKKTGCKDSTEVVITEPDTLSATAEIKHLACFRDSNGVIKLTTAGGSPLYTWKWKTNPVKTTAEIKDLKAGTYEVEIKDAHQCTINKSFMVKEEPFPSEEYTINANYCKGDSAIVLHAEKNYAPYQWYVDGVAVPNATADSFKVKNFDKKITVTWKRDGCWHRSAEMVLSDVPNYFLPDIGTTIFTPNGDSHSDYFYPFSSKILPDQIQYYAKDYNLKVFDRWGKKIFETSDYSRGWDGTYSGGQATAGVYYWITTYVSRCGSGDKKSTGKGYVHLMR